ncbi:MAG: hypothetical protein RMK99_03905 [Anaerolineales bacterium]|nr:hypothetical protein [Anaerolineales bacterium]
MPPLCPSASFAERSQAQDVLRGGHPERTLSEAEAVAKAKGRPPFP